MSMTIQSTSGELYSPKEVIKDGKRLGYPLKYRSLLKHIKNGTMKSLNFGTREKPRYYITKEYINDWQRNSL